MKRGGLEIGAKVDDIEVRGNVAYVASADQYQLRAVDISVPSNPVVIATFSPSGWQRQEGKAISSFEDGLSFGRTSGGFNIATDHELFAWATSSTVNSTAPDSLDISGGVYGIIADKRHIFAATRTLNKEFSIFDSSLASSASTTYSLPVAPQTMTCNGSNIYVLANTAPYIYEISFK